MPCLVRWAGKRSGCTPDLTLPPHSPDWTRCVLARGPSDGAPLGYVSRPSRVFLQQDGGRVLRLTVGTTRKEVRHQGRPKRTRRACLGGWRGPAIAPADHASAAGRG